MNRTNRSPITTEHVFVLVGNQQVQAEEELALELDALDCVRLPDRSVLVRYRDGHYEQIHGEESPALDFIGGEDAGSLLTDLALPKDFPLSVSVLLQNIWSRLGLSPDVSVDALVPRLAKLRGGEYKAALCLAYGELLRTRMSGEWVGIAHAAGVEPALVTRSAGIVHFSGYLLRLATKRELPALNVVLNLALS